MGAAELEIPNKTLVKRGDSLWCASESAGVALPEEISSMDSDSLSGMLLESYKGKPVNEIFELFYKLNVDRIDTLVRSFGRGYAWNRDPTEMITDIFYDIYRYAQAYSYKSGAAFNCWIRVLAKNRMRKAVRIFHSKQRSLYINADDQKGSGANNPCSMAAYNEELNISQKGVRLLLFICVKAISKATAIEREALSLHELHGMTYREISKRFQISLPSTAVLIRRGRRKVVRFMVAYLKQIG